MVKIAQVVGININNMMVATGENMIHMNSLLKMLVVVVKVKKNSSRLILQLRKDRFFIKRQSQICK
jgi:hypothetical protein